LNFMKNKLFLTVVLIGLATFSAHAGVYVGVSFGVPLPVPIVVPTPCVGVVAGPVAVAAPVVVAAPFVPAPGYVWAPGYWSVCGYSRVWVAGGWRCRPACGVYGHPYGRRGW
jgi:hypothetical protein